MESNAFLHRQMSMQPLQLESLHLMYFSITFQTYFSFTEMKQNLVHLFRYISIPELKDMKHLPRH